jgi:hypothetical protein
MKRALAFAVAAAAVQFVSSAALGDSRFVHKSGTNTATCGQNTNTADTTNGPCLTLGQAYTNGTVTGGTATLIIISNGVFTETVNLNVSGKNVIIRHTNDNAVTIQGPSGANAIDVNLGNSDSVKLYDVWLGGNGGTANVGINVVNVGRMELHKVSIRGFGQQNILYQPTAPSSDLFVLDSDVAESNGTCLLVKPAGPSNSANANIKNSQIHHCGNLGVRSDSSNTSSFVRTLLSNSIVSNIANGAASSVSGGAGGTARVLVENTDVMNSNTGVTANGANAQIVLNAATLVGNGTAAVSTNGGAIFSYGNSVINFNAANGVTPTVLGLK